jgi:hypothetical protein
MKHKWLEVDGLRYVAIYEDDYNHCNACAFIDTDGQDVCKKVACSDHIYIPLEVQHIPNLRKKGKKL